MIDALMEQQQQQHSVSPLPPPMRLRGGAAVHSANNGNASRSRFAALGAHQFDASHRRPFNPSDTHDSGHNVDGSAFCSPDAPLLASRRLGGGLVNRPSGGGSPPTAHTNPTSSSRFSPQSAFHGAANGGSNMEGFGAPLPARALPGNHRSLQLSSASPASFSSSSSSSSSQAASFAATSMTDSPVAAMRSLSIAAVRERRM